MMMIETAVDAGGRLPSGLTRKQYFQQGSVLYRIKLEGRGEPLPETVREAMDAMRPEGRSNGRDRGYGRGGGGSNGRRRGGRRRGGRSRTRRPEKPGPEVH
ncbi:MAG: hypothetical protein M5R36_22295 [Deltaproteobacteria bacterium]|nr:hypothetical protein [Deltaproteobacteria bacterium]